MRLLTTYSHMKLINRLRFWMWISLFSFSFLLEFIFGVFSPKKGWWCSLFISPFTSFIYRLIPSGDQLFKYIIGTLAQCILYSFLLSIETPWRRMALTTLVVVHFLCMLNLLQMTFQFSFN